MTKINLRSRSFWIILSSAIFAAMLVATGIALLVYYLTPLPTLRIATVYPKENYVVVVVKQDPEPGSEVSYKNCTVIGGQLQEGEEAYTYPDRDKPIEEYENVVTIENPLRSQVVFQEQYQVTALDGEVRTREVKVYGDGNLTDGFVDPA